MCIKEREEKKTEILVKYCSSRNRGFNSYAKRQESCDKMMGIGSVGWALSKCGEALGWICLLFSPAHPVQVSVAAWQVYTGRAAGDCSLGLLSECTGNSAKPPLEGADFWRAFASPLFHFMPAFSSLFLQPSPSSNPFPPPPSI